VLSTAFAVAMDAVAVAALTGMTRGRASWREVLTLSGIFGIFQAVMPALGYAGGALFRDAIADYDHWVAFVLLAAVGAHMVKESRGGGVGERATGDPFATRRLLLLGFATSIDALAVGLTLALLEVPVGVAVGIIGLTTFLLCIPAARLGARLGSAFAHRAEFLGGVVLIAIGTSILIQHLSGAG
jgi:putative Mn2+ efflux pump MntP